MVIGCLRGVEFRIRVFLSMLLFGDEVLIDLFQRPLDVVSHTGRRKQLRGFLGG